MAVGEDDDETIEWLYDVLEFWIRLRYVIVYKNTLAHWHDAEWKNALHRAACDDGATVVTEAGELAPRVINAPAPPLPTLALPNARVKIGLLTDLIGLIGPSEHIRPITPANRPI